MLKLFNIISRRYQTKTGVFGHVPIKKSKNYQIPHEDLKARAENSNFYRLVTAYRTHGHETAHINPISLTEPQHNLPELEPSQYDLNLDQKVNFQGIINQSRRGTIREAIEFLREKYCQNVGAEFMHLPVEEKEWFAEKLEANYQLPEEEKKELLIELLKSQVFDNFLASKFSTLKRYGGEGAESASAFFLKILTTCQANQVTDLVIGMPHRGRLNILTGLFKLPPELVFRKIKGLSEFPATAEATGDVLSHLISSVDIGSVHISVLPNPSHLEAVNPVSMGKTRAKQMSVKEGAYGDGSTQFGDKILNIQIHGDAAFIGQGVNQETISLSKVPHFEVGGTIHLIVNNQVGFTTPGDRGRSSTYATDLAKTVLAPVLHVNGDDPEEVSRVTEIAFEYQRTFRKDVFVDLNCYRQWGHNELDDPTFTNPAIYKIINNRKTVPDIYAEKLVTENILHEKAVEEIKTAYHAELNERLKNESYNPSETYFTRQWSGMQQASKNLTTWDTGMDTEILRFIGMKSIQFPESFNIHKHLLKTHVNARLARLNGEGQGIDWSTAESMAIGSLLYQGYNVRISGQDVGRGTFSHRHAMLVDQDTNDIYIPLNNVIENQAGKLEIANSTLSEEAVLGYEYGMSIENPNNLILWEAQFGDFFNGAQIIIDTFVTSGETKWMKCSGLVLLLPHGYDGAGPEHSSARIERFLQLTNSKETQSDGDNVNFQIVVPTTPAQYFHLLRRQVLRNYRKPLVVIAPKTLLRLAEACSPLQAFEPNTTFQNIIVEEKSNQIRKVVFTSGKFFYSLDKVRRERNLQHVAIVRLESLCPFPTHDLQKLLEKEAFKNVKDFVWSQEEPRNMGAWGFIKPRFENLVGVRLRYVGQEELSTPALVGQAHTRSQEKTIEDTLRE